MQYFPYIPRRSQLHHPRTCHPRTGRAVQPSHTASLYVPRLSLSLSRPLTCTSLTDSIVFVSADVVALTIQAVGGGLASSAADPAGAEDGAKVMLGGILLQFVAIIIYTTLAFEFLVRYFAEWPLRQNGQRGMLDTRLRLMVIGLCISTFFLLIRYVSASGIWKFRNRNETDAGYCSTIYRTIELQDGWTGSIISNEKLFSTSRAFLRWGATSKLMAVFFV